VVSASELDEVQALLERVLPDPAGFAQRLALQAMTRWGQSAEPGPAAFYTATDAADLTVGDILLTPDRPGEQEPPVDTNMLLAAALGACECWGLQAGCDLCWGQGCAGWIQPDPELFEEFIQPAIARLDGLQAGEPGQDGSGKARQDASHPPTAKGENR
jgi:hypothetical protein